MSTYNRGLYEDLIKIIFKLSSNTHLISASVCIMKPVFGVFNQVDTNQPVWPQTIASGLRFQIYEVEGLNYQCSKNKGSDQLHGCCAADPHL